MGRIGCMGRGRLVGGSCLAGSGVGEARGSSPTASYNDYQVSVPFEALVCGKFLRLGLCACTIVGRWIGASVSSTEVSVFVCVHGYFPYRLIQTSLLKKNFRPFWDLLYSSMALRHTASSHASVAGEGRMPACYARFPRQSPEAAIRPAWNSPC